MKVALACDHGGFRLKERLKKMLGDRGFDVLDYGTDSEKPVDYPDFCLKLSEAVARKKAERGILACKSGIGMSICANKVKGIRAALVATRKEAELSRRHNDANVLVLAGNFISTKKAGEIVRLWLRTSFDGGRHERRIRKIERYEDKHWN